jgi:thioredoxin 1
MLRSIRWFPQALAGALVALLFPGCEHAGGHASHNDTNIVLLTKSNFAEQVLNSSQPVLVDYWAEWCGPCQTLAPRVSELAAQYIGRIKFGKVDIDKQESLAEQYQVEAYPTLLFFKNGKVVDRSVGVLEKKELQEKLEQLLAAGTAKSP